MSPVDLPAWADQVRSEPLVGVERRHVIPALIVVVLSLVALGDHPYSYYTFLRWAVFAAAAFVTYRSFVSGGVLLAAPAAAVAVLFNPLAPFYMDKDAWSVWNVLTAVVFGIYVWLPLIPRKQSEQNEWR